MQHPLEIGENEGIKVRVVSQYPLEDYKTIVNKTGETPAQQGKKPVHLKLKGMMKRQLRP